MVSKLNAGIAVIGIDIGKNSFHIVGLDRRRDRPTPEVVSRPSRNTARQRAALSHWHEACAGAHHLSRKLSSLGHDARLMPAKYVRPYSRGQKNDFRDAEAIAEAVQRPTMKFVAIKTAEQRNVSNDKSAWIAKRSSA